MRQSETAYPPREFCGESKEEVGQWIQNCHAHSRWVIQHSNLVIGHISLASPEDYLTDFLQSHGVSGEHDEISKFFIQPEYRKTGAGSLLFSHVLQASSKPKALAVLNGSRRPEILPSTWHEGTGYIQWNQRDQPHLQTTHPIKQVQSQ